MTIDERLTQLSTVGTVIPCPMMRLIAADHEPPIVVGEGELTVSRSTSFKYSLRGTPIDIGHALRSLRRIDADPYDGTLRERLDLTTSSGLSLSGGWTTPSIRLTDDGRTWTFNGEIDSLSFLDDGDFEAGTKVAFTLPHDSRAGLVLRRFMDATDDGNMREKALTINGAELHLVFDDDAAHNDAGPGARFFEGIRRTRLFQDLRRAGVELDPVAGMPVGIGLVILQGLPAWSHGDQNGRLIVIWIDAGDDLTGVEATGLLHDDVQAGIGHAGWQNLIRRIIVADERVPDLLGK